MQPDAPPAGDRREGPRPDGRPVNRTVLHVTHMLVGVAIGFFFASLGYLFAVWQHGGTSRIVTNLWWVAGLTTVIQLFALREAMDAIRETVFVETVDGERRETRRRRRHEVIMALVWRASVAFVLGGLAMGGLYHLSQVYHDELARLSPLFQGRGLPPVFHELMTLVYAFVIGVLTLVLCESTLRSTQKRGFPWQIICLFLPAALGVALAMQLLARFVG